MSSLAIQKAPKKWDELKYQDSPVKLAKHWLKTNDFPNLIFISGSSGIGKTSFAILLSKAIHCLNREAGEVEPCGHCAVCTRDPRSSGAGSNLIWVQAGTAESMAKQVERALSEANTKPYGINEDHRDWKIIVFDELQSIQQHIQKLLYFPDLARCTENRVLFIAVTMAEESLKPVDLDAFKSRGSYLKLKTLTDDHVFLTLRNNFPDYPLESLNLIAKAADGNMRAAYNTLERCRIISEDLNPMDVSIELQFVDSTLRKTIWNYLELAKTGDPNSVQHFIKYRELWKSISDYVDDKKFLQQMLDDLAFSFQLSPTEDKQTCLSLIMNQLGSKTRIRVDQFLLTFAGNKLIDPRVFENCDQTLEEKLLKAA